MTYHVVVLFLVVLVESRNISLRRSFRFDDWKICLDLCCRQQRGRCNFVLESSKETNETRRSFDVRRSFVSKMGAVTIADECGNGTVNVLFL